MPGQRGQIGGHAMGLDVAPLSKEPQGQLPHLARHQTRLDGRDQAHGQVGLPLQQVVQGIVEVELETQLRPVARQLRQDPWQGGNTQGLAGRDAHHARDVIGPTAGQTLQRRDLMTQCLGLGPQRLGQRGRLVAVLGPGKQRHAQRRFQGVDVATHGGLGHTQLTRSRRQRAMPQHRQKASVQAPIDGVGMGHGKGNRKRPADIAALSCIFA